MRIPGSTTEDKKMILWAAEYSRELCFRWPSLAASHIQPCFPRMFSKNCSQAATILSKSTLGNQDWRATPLPTDFHYETERLVQLHLKPGTRFLKTAQGQRAGTEHYEEIEAYDYNNPNDTSNFCPGLHAAESDDEESENLSVGSVGTLDHSGHPPMTTQDNNDSLKSKDQISQLMESQTWLLSLRRQIKLKFSMLRLTRRWT